MRHYGTIEVDWRLLPRTSLLQFNLEVQLREAFTYYVGGAIGDPLQVPTGTYDGFSVPWIFRLLSLFQLSQVMAGVEAAFVHDAACRQQWGTRKQRRQLFKEAYDAAMREFYPEHTPDAWSSVLTRGVVVGSKYLRRC